ncbi:MAG: hypothetical protein GY723_13695 [bacterium]|nr:hypothetical protein [bacterium]MCP5068432.1 hypothetical protein [bacterium]
MSSPHTHPEPDLVAEPDWLESHLDNPRLRILDVRWGTGDRAGEEAYRGAHIPGARFIDLVEPQSVTGGQGPDPSPAARKTTPDVGQRGLGLHQEVTHVGG